ncbi:BTB POZ domain-containing [Hyphodiscus hymeniophilus]|uniref:BTB POZ domain-containing n=1 Tax=Hyphodiscus hymeniophilus TaxID=353542 RepID=A0A9P6VJS4_9HELO|nr:BTB POZ domain-containing [Hyphodiscus hymeniophilus]
MASNGGGNGERAMSGTASTLPPGSEGKTSTEPPGILRDPALIQARRLNTDIPHILPHERVFPIQIGSELFRLSGASISSDVKAPSYFSQFFQFQLKQAEENGDDSNTVRTLYIDRDPVTFKDISLHLQGYHISPRDGSHFVKLFADAQFYSLPRLISQLYEESIFISIGYRDFQIPREVFSDPGNSPNYFSLGFGVFFSTPSEIFPGLNREGLLRPPSIVPPSVPNRSADTFAELLHLLRGYPLHIKNDDHRAELLRDCRYFHLKGLEQKLIRCHISFNLARRRQEICLRLEDLRQSGISVVWDSSMPAPPEAQPHTGLVGWVNYARPFVDDKAYELVLEIGDDSTKIQLHTMRAEFFGEGKAKISRLFEVIATKLNLPTTMPLGLLMAKGERRPNLRVQGIRPLARIREWHGSLKEDDVSSTTSSISLSGHESPASSASGQPPRKRKRVDISGGNEETWLVKTGQWRLRVQNARNGKGGVECVLVAVKLDAVSGEQGRNAQRAFLA